MKYSTNMTRDLQKRAKKALHMLFREVDARGWEHKEVDVTPSSGHKTSRERGSLNPRDTGYGFNDGHRDYFVSATEQVDIVQREPTKQELEDHERDLRWWPNARIKKFYDHPYTGNLTITIGKYQAKDSITRTAETSIPAVFTQITLSHCWVDYDREMNRRARELWDKKVAIADKQVDEILRNRQLYDALRERAVEWEDFTAIQGYVGDLKAYVATLPEDSRASAQAWLTLCEDHVNDRHPLHGVRMPAVALVSEMERQSLVAELAQTISDLEALK